MVDFRIQELWFPNLRKYDFTAQEFSICYKILKYRRKVMFERLREIEIFSDIEKTMKTKSEIVKCVE